jgi:hypothetical protein
MIILLFLYTLPSFVESIGGTVPITLVVGADSGPGAWGLGPGGPGDWRTEKLPCPVVYPMPPIFASRKDPAKQPWLGQRGGAMAL